MSSAEVVVKTSKGSVRGKKVPSIRRGNYYSFQGIPYAKPPVGELRFKAPVEAEPWTGIRDAQKEGPIAPSNNFFTNEYVENSSEDCLFLNVYTTKIPDDDTEQLKAVLFWIHGGGFSLGSGNTDFYSPDYLVTENVVVVTCNYRLGPLGFLSLQTPECPGNNGLKDILMALKWCQENISKFGGDPKNITIFGESAGAAAVHYLTLTKKSEGLFHKAIAQSGVATNPWGIAMKPRECAFKLGEALGCKTNDDKNLLEFLKGVKAADLVAKTDKILRVIEPREYYIKNAFVPCIEPEIEEALITKHPDDIYKAGEFQKIPFLLGVNDLEGLIVLSRKEQISELKTDKELERLIPKNLNVQPGSKLAGEIVTKIRNFYFSRGFDEVSFVNALSRIYFLNAISQVIEHLSNFSSTSAPVYYYKFIYNGSILGVKHFLGFAHWKGTCHGDELKYLFYQKFFNFNIPQGSKDYSMMETLTKIWTDFAKTGTPILDKSNSWSPISKNNFPYMEIDEVLTQKSDMEKKEFEFWKEIHKMASQTQTNSIIRPLSSASAEIIVNTNKGLLRGRRVPSARRGYYYSFQGIPYAKPPVGDLRFRAPEEHDSWTGVRDALKEGHTAPSFDLKTNKFNKNSSEDCLFLNIYTPELPKEDSKTLKAVLFWVHGGAFFVGSGNTDFYSPDYLMTENVVLITCNYRLGPLGFLSLQTSKCPGNNGIKDVFLALKWCQHNISNFGGDPKNVTLLGQSAGGVIVHYLTLTKKTEGLFHKSIAQSGVATNTWGKARKSRESAFKLGEVLGFRTDDDEKLLSFLKKAPVEDLTVKALGILNIVEPKEFYSKNAFVPCLEPESDEALITKHPDIVYKTGEMRKIPFILGVNNLEGLMSLKREIPELKTDKELERLIPTNLNVESGSYLAKKIVKKIREFYFPKGFDEVNFVNALSRFCHGNAISQTVEYLSNYSSTQAPVYYYRFIYNGDIIAMKQFKGFGHWKGACHCDELAYLFKQPFFNYKVSKGTKEYTMMETMTKMWTNFAKTGNPIPDKPDFWSPLSKNKLPYLEIDENLTQKFNLEQKEFEFWKEIFKMATEC